MKLINEVKGSEVANKYPMITNLEKINSDVNENLLNDLNSVGFKIEIGTPTSQSVSIVSVNTNFLSSLKGKTEKDVNSVSEYKDIWNFYNKLSKTYKTNTKKIEWKSGSYDSMIVTNTETSTSNQSTNNSNNVNNNLGGAEGNTDEFSTIAKNTINAITSAGLETAGFTESLTKKDEKVLNEINRIRNLM